MIASVRLSRTVQPSDRSSSDLSHLEQRHELGTDLQMKAPERVFIYISIGEMSYFVMCLILLLLRRGCGYPPWPG